MITYFMQPWLPPVLGAILWGVLGVALLASYWLVRTPLGDKRQRKSWLSRHSSLAILVFPVSAALGAALIFFPVGVPEILVLRSRSQPDSVPTTYNGLFNTEYEHIDGGQKLRVLNAGPVVDRALQIIAGQNGELGDASSFDPAVGRMAIEEALEEERNTHVLPVMRPPRSGLPRWLVESIEIAIVRALALEHNVRDAVIEVHRRGDVEIDAWQILAADLRNDLPAGHAPKIVDGSPLGAGEATALVGDPWIQPSLTGSDTVALFLRLRRGSEHDSFPVLRLLQGETRLRMSACSGCSPTDELSVDNLDAYRALGFGVITIIRLDLSGFSNDADKQVKAELISMDGSGRVDSHSVQLGFIPTSRVAILPGLSGREEDRLRAKATLRKLARGEGCNSAALAAFRMLVAAGSKELLVTDAVGDADVFLYVEKDGVWIAPSSVGRELLDTLYSHRHLPIRRSGSINPTNEYFGMALFPGATREQYLQPGPLSLNAVPLNPKHLGSSEPSVDPASNISPLDGPVFEDTVATVAASSYMSYPNRAWREGAVFATAAPFATRFVIPRQDGHPGVAYFFAVDLAEQGLLIRADDCVPNEPAAYEQVRFFPIWGAFIQAIGEAHGNALADALEPDDVHREALFLLNDEMKGWARVRSAGPGFLLIAIGLAGHTIFMIILRLKWGKNGE